MWGQCPFAAAAAGQAKKLPSLSFKWLALTGGGMARYVLIYTQLSPALPCMVLFSMQNNIPQLCGQWLGGLLGILVFRIVGIIFCTSSN